MGQKVNPIGFRTAVHKQWKSRWFAERKEFGNLLNEDLEIRDLVRTRLTKYVLLSPRTWSNFLVWVCVCTSRESFTIPAVLPMERKE